MRKSVLAVIALYILMLCDSVIYARDPYYGGYGYVDAKAATIGESHARGMADVVRSAGRYNLETSAAMQNAAAARKQQIQNRHSATITYFEMRKINKAYHDSLRRKRASEEELIKYAQKGLPKRLSASQLDPITGKIKWPIVLTSKDYTNYRTSVELLFKQRAYAGGNVGLERYQKIQQTTSAWLEVLKTDVRKYKDLPNDYLTAKHFLKSLAYESRYVQG